jgi:hypothetical protein
MGSHKVRPGGRQRGWGTTSYKVGIFYYVSIPRGAGTVTISKVVHPPPNRGNSTPAIAPRVAAWQTGAIVLVEAGDHRLKLVHTPEETKAVGLRSTTASN